MVWFVVVAVVGFVCYSWTIMTVVSGFSPLSSLSYSVSDSSSSSSIIRRASTRRRRRNSASSSSSSSEQIRLQESRTAGSSDDLTIAAEELQQAFESCKSDITKACKVRISGGTGGDGDATSTTTTVHRLGLVATESISKGDVMLSVPFDDRTVLTAKLAREVVFADVFPESYEGWTGDAGLIALLILNEVARAAATSSTCATTDTDTATTSSTTTGSLFGTPLPQRSDRLSGFMQSWVKSLPTAREMIVSGDHAFFWSEQEQEVLQSSSTNKIYRKLDDLEEDANWWVEHVFQMDRTRFPETVCWTAGTSPTSTDNKKEDGPTTTTTINIENTTTINCFNVLGFKWALALALSRSCFLEGRLRLIPIVDMCNHDDAEQEVQVRGMGTFGSIKGATLVAAKSYRTGDEVFCSYGPKSAADYLLEHGFCPDRCWKTSVAEVAFEMDPKDRFYDDKMDILEYETYEQAPMDPTQSFDVTSSAPIMGVGGGGRSGRTRGDGEPDPAMMQFLRLAKLGGTDAFLLESIFRKEVWGFMAFPVSEKNEFEVVNAITDACQAALDELQKCPEGGPALCAKLRDSECRALARTIEYLSREREALDLKEYYQQRRLKDLGLDSEWSPEDDMMSSDLGFGQTRAPGGADYDW